MDPDDSDDPAFGGPLARAQRDADTIEKQSAKDARDAQAAKDALEKAQSEQTAVDAAKSSTHVHVSTSKAAAQQAKDDAAKSSTPQTPAADGSKTNDSAAAKDNTKTDAAASKKGSAGSDKAKEGQALQTEAQERQALQEEIAKLKQERKMLQKKGSTESHVAKESQALQEETKTLKRERQELEKAQQTTSTVGRTSQKSLDTSVLKEKKLDKESDNLPKLGSAGGHYKTIRMDKIVKGIWMSDTISKWDDWKIFFRMNKASLKGPHGTTYWKYLDPAIGSLKKSIKKFSSEEKDLLWKRVHQVPRCDGIFGGTKGFKKSVCGTDARSKRHKCGAQFCQHGTLNRPKRVLGPTSTKNMLISSNKKHFPVVYEKRMSWAVPGVQREFLVMNFSGRATPDQYGMYWLRTEACKIQYYNYLANCSNCCCTGGYIQTESKAFNVSPEGHNCE